MLNLTMIWLINSVVSKLWATSYAGELDELASGKDASGKQGKCVTECAQEHACMCVCVQHTLASGAACNVAVLGSAC